MFLEFIEKKKLKVFNDELVNVTKGYCELIQVESEGKNQIFKVVINPNANKTVCFIVFPDDGVINFLKNQPFFTKKVIIIPSKDDEAIANAVKDEKIDLHCIISKTDSDKLCYYANIKGLDDLAKKYFSVVEKEHSGVDVDIEVPKSKKASEFIKKVMKLIVNDYCFV